MKLHSVLAAVTDRIRDRSAGSRGAYLHRLEQTARRDRGADRMGCANVAHAFAGMPASDKFKVVAERAPNIAIVNAYNDMLSAHTPLGRYPDLIKDEARRHGATAQVAGGVPAMCDGVTQGTPGMELSLFSRDVIAMATAVSLSHDVFDAALMLGVCDKIVPGLLIGALHFGHLPTVFIPAGPMTSGLSNNDKAKIREQAAQGLVGRAELLDAEQRAYHSPGTCTFYGTANSNQMLLEAMGLHVPGTAFVNPGNELREQLTREAVRTVLGTTTATPGDAGAGRRAGPPQARPAPSGLEPAAPSLPAQAWTGDRDEASGEARPARPRAVHEVTSVGATTCPPIGRVVDERCIVNAMTALLATGGSTNHLIHWVAVARAAGILIDWNDFAELSAIVPLLSRVYPNGSADVNQFQAAGGPGYVIRELLDAGLMHEDVLTVRAGGLRDYTRVPAFTNALSWQEIGESKDEQVVRPAVSPFSPTGGLKLLNGNLGRAVIKVSAVPEDRHIIEAPALVFNTQEQLLKVFADGDLDRACQASAANGVICVVRWQGPQANGMPELHKLTPPLAVLQGRGFRVALVTDGRMSGASGKVPAAIHVSPEAAAGGALAKVRDGDLLRLDAVAGTLQALVPEAEWAARDNASMPAALMELNGLGMGRELFAGFRRHALTAEEGACAWL